MIVSMGNLQYGFKTIELTTTPFLDTTPKAVPVMSYMENVQPLLLNAQGGKLTQDMGIDKIAQMLIDSGQEILIGVAGVFAVVCGILIATGLKKEGWQRFANIFQGLGVGLIGPSAVALTALMFVTLASNLG